MQVASSSKSVWTQQCSTPSTPTKPCPAARLSESLLVKDLGPCSGESAETTVPSLSTAEVISHCDEDDFLDRSTGVEIICIGLMRTGLKTLNQALQVLGHTQIYDQEQIAATYELWNEVIENRRTEQTFTNIFQGAKVAMGMPTFCFWEEILQENPNAKVILTVRDEDDWLDSVERAKQHMDQDLPGMPLAAGSVLRSVERFLVPSYHRFCEVLRFAWSSSLGMLDTQMNRDCVLNNYRKHNHYVQAMLSESKTCDGRPQLLVYDVRDGWEPLCEFLGHKVPETSYPSVMHVPYFGNDAAGPGVSANLPFDYGGEFQDILVPDSEFGRRMRSELRTGLALLLVVAALIAAPVVWLVQWMHILTVSPLVLTIMFLVASCVSWNAYVVMHSLVMRVPAIVVLPMVLKSLLMASCLHACYITYGILKEQLVTQDKVVSPVLILATRSMSVLCATVVIYMAEGKVSFRGPPLHHFIAFGLSNEVSTWAGYAVLNYLSYPVQVMAKSSKVLPSMLMGRFLNQTRYSSSEYLQALGAMLCVAIMHLCDPGTHSAGTSDPETLGSGMRALIGVGWLIVFFAADGFAGQWQTALYKRHPELTMMKMMFVGNFVGMLITFVSVSLRWTAVRTSLAFALENPEVLGRILLLGLSGALGQCCIYAALKILGSLYFIWIMTARQLLSVLISLVIFGHGVSPLKLTCIVTVFAIMSSKQLTQVLPLAVQQAVHVSVRKASAITRTISTSSLSVSWDLAPLRRLSSKTLGDRSSTKED